MNCLVTGNECGTDTWQIDYECPCLPCRIYVLTSSELKGYKGCYTVCECRCHEPRDHEEARHSHTFGHHCFIICCAKAYERGAQVVFRKETPQFVMITAPSIKPYDAPTTLIFDIRMILESNSVKDKG